MKTRIISACVMLPALLIVYFGGYALLAACFLVAVVGLGEFYRGFEAMGIRPSHWIGNAAVVALYAINLLTDRSGITGDSVLWHLLWVFGVIAASILYLFRIDERKPEDGMATMTGVFYVVFFSYHAVLIDQFRSGANEYHLLIWLVFITAFATDIMAYFTGYAFGKHKLCPKISPKKTVEGSIGGIVGSILCSGLFGYFAVPQLLADCLLIGALGGVISQFGDLSASVFKRKMGIKDYGTLIPGHGGIMDRFDSVMFTAPMVYYYIAFVLAG